MASDDPLSKLLVDKAEIDRKALAEALEDYAKLDRTTGDAVFTPAFSDLGNQEKVLLFLLSRKARKLLGLPMEREEATPTEVSNGTGIKLGSVKPIVWGLEKKMILVKKGASYAVPDHAVNVVSRMLEKKIQRK